jgi:predicted enzyme related to lactoylglutathione lyase
MDGPSARTQEAPVALHFVAKDMERLRASLEAWGGSFSHEPEEIDRRGLKILQAGVRDPDGNEMRVVQNL